MPSAKNILSVFASFFHLSKRVQGQSSLCAAIPNQTMHLKLFSYPTNLYFSRCFLSTLHLSIFCNLIRCVSNLVACCPKLNSQKPSAICLGARSCQVASDFMHIETETCIINAQDHRFFWSFELTSSAIISRSNRNQLIHVNFLLLRHQKYRRENLTPLLISEAQSVNYGLRR